MLTVDLYAKIRLAHRDGLGIRALARKFGCSRQAVRKALQHAQPPPFRQPQPRHAPKLGSFRSIIDQILADDEKAPPKQRHYATHLFQRLVEEYGYQGSYDQVRRYVQAQRQAKVETFIPLSHAPGSRVECDFGHVYVDFPEGRRPIAVLLVTWAYSHFPFALALPSEKTEAILEGMVQAFEFFGCVPREAWWDNPTTVATAIFPGRQRRLHPRYQALASHYNFEPLFCLPRRGQEKPHVENRVKRLQRRWATPVPQIKDLEEFNTYLRRQCESERRRTVQRLEDSIGARFTHERAKALALPSFRFDACVLKTAVVDKYQTVRFETTWYSVPRSLAFQKVTVKGYVDRVEIVHGGQVQARHVRCYQRHAQILDPVHYLVTLARKPAALDHADVYRRWQLPGSFAQLRQHLEAQHGPRTGTRHYIRVLQLLAQHPAERVSQAIQMALERGYRDAHLIIEQAERLAALELTAAHQASSQEGPVEALRLRAADTGVSSTSLRHFDQLLSKGEASDESTPDSAVARQPEAAEAADDAGPV
jgi:transposase